ncbi:MAG TPA: pyridoxal phosphate-dependent aminotransferase, partial [Vicinamibacterales bacterium]
HYGPPAAAIEAARAALADPSIHEYQAVEGIRSLRRALAAKLARENGIDVGESTGLMVTAGANLAFMHAVMATSEPGDEIVLPVPFYFNHEMAIQMAGCRVVPVPTDDRYQPRLDAIRSAITARTRAVVTISPNNPTGAVYGESILRDINALCAERGLYHISDEVYEYFTYEGARHVSPASFDGASAHTIAIYSLSKAYGFAGWRIGYFTYPAHLAAAMLKSQDTLLVCPPIVTQMAALAAVEVGRTYSAPYVEELGEVRRLVLDALASLGALVTVPRPDGAFYCFMKVNRDVDPMALAGRLIREHRVAVMPGTAFGMSDGCYFRVAYGALQKATVTEGIGRLVEGLRTLTA